MVSFWSKGFLATLFHSARYRFWIGWVRDKLETVSGRVWTDLGYVGDRLLDEFRMFVKRFAHAGTTRLKRKCQFLQAPQPQRGPSDISLSLPSWGTWHSRRKNCEETLNFVKMKTYVMTYRLRRTACIPASWQIADISAADTFSGRET